MVTLPDQRSFLHRRFLASPVSRLTPLEAYTVNAQTSTFECLQTMSARRMWCALITGDDGAIVGIFTERDALNKLPAQKTDLKNTPISAFISSPVQTLSSNVSIARLVHCLAVGGFRHVPIVSASPSKKVMIVSSTNFVDYIYGVISSRITQQADPPVLNRNNVDQLFVRPLSALNPAAPVVCLGSFDLKRAIERMQEQRLGSVLIVDQQRRLKGIFTERDFVERVILRELPLDSTPLEQVMTSGPQSLIESNTVAMAFNLLSEGGFRHIPIMNAAEDLVGILTVRNFLQVISENIIADLSAVGGSD